MSTKRKRGGFPKGKNPIKGAFNILGLRKPSKKKVSNDDKKMSDGDITQIMDKYFIRSNEFRNELKKIYFPQKSDERGNDLTPYEQVDNFIKNWSDSHINEQLNPDDLIKRIKHVNWKKSNAFHTEYNKYNDYQ